MELPSFMQFSDVSIFTQITNKLKKISERKITQFYQKSLEAEKKLLELNDVKIGQDYEIVNVDLQRNNQFLHSYRSLNENQGKKKLILLHGYGMSGLAYMKLLKPLTEKYEVHCLDLPGMGLSSREDFTDINEEKETIDYFVSSLEAYRRINNIDKFTLAGHSFGGYMSANYAMQHPQHIENLVLISPLGSTYRSTEEINKQYVDYINKQSTLKKPFIKCYLEMFKNKVTLQQATQQWFLPLKAILTNYVRAALNLNEKEQSIYSSFIYNMINLPESSSKALYNIIIDQSVFVKSPFEHTFPKQMSSKIPIHFLFGDNDWMDYGGAYKLFREQKEHNLNIKFNYVSKTRHQVTMDNPKFLTNYLLNL